jgi:predicted esterase
MMLAVAAKLDPGRGPPMKNAAETSAPAHRRLWATGLRAIAAAVLASGAPAFGQPASAPTGLLASQTFDDFPASAHLDALLPRVMSPLAAEALRRKLAAHPARVRDEADLKQERFTLYVPASRPPGGYGVLVFEPPWDDARPPRGWETVLDRHGIVFVTFARAGNDQNVVTRREPLALIALQNVLDRYPVDRSRVFVGGFSGGAHVALRLALQFPDLFRGALLNAGSDPIGETPLALPPRELMDRFQADSRLVYATGGNDPVRLAMDNASIASLKPVCVSNVSTVNAGVGHDVLDAQSLDRALGELTRPSQPDPARLAVCRAALQARVQGELDKAKALIAAGRRDSARRALLNLDETLGGVDGPGLIALADSCDCGIFEDQRR